MLVMPTHVKCIAGNALKAQMCTIIMVNTDEESEL